MYRERPSRIPGAHVWTAVADTASSLVLPDGCIDLLWDGAAVRVAGPDRTAHRHHTTVGAVLTGLRFAPGAAPAVLGLPADELTDRQVPLAQLWSAARAREFADRLAAAADPGAALEAEVTRLVGGAVGAGPPAALAHASRRLRAGVAVDDVATELGMSRRQLHRRSLAAFGYGPKLLARILRLQDALALARQGVPLVDVAAARGYADQAHLARDVRDLAGTPIRQLL